MGIFESILNTVVSSFFAIWPQKKSSARNLTKVQIVAHRGIHENNLAKENSMASFQLAVDHKIWGIEFDVRMTKDEVPIIHHDPIENISFHELRKKSPHIPSLEEVVRQFGKKIHLMIEIKEDYSLQTNRAVKITNVLKSLTPKSDFHLMSFYPEQLEVFTDLPKSCFIDIIWTNPKEIFALNSRLGHGGLAGHFLFITDTQLQTLHKESKVAGVGYPDSKNSLYREVNRSVDFIFTNHPLLLSKFLTEALDRASSQR